MGSSMSIASRARSSLDGELRNAPPLEEREEFSLDGVTYEAFNTSGGIGTLCDTLAGRVRNLNYRTIRYPGHRDHESCCCRTCGSASAAMCSRDISENALPHPLQDVVDDIRNRDRQQQGRLIAGNLRQQGLRQDCQRQRAQRHPDRPPPRGCARCSTCGAGKLPQRGFVRQEESARGVPRQPFRQGYARAAPDDSARSALMRRRDRTSPARRRSAGRQLAGRARSRPIDERRPRSRLPIDGARRQHRSTPGSEARGSRVPPSRPGARCRHRGAANWCAAVRRARASPQAGARRTDHAWRPARSQRGLGRSAGSHRHLRLRGRPLAPALRPDDRLGAGAPPHARALASARPGRRSSARSTFQWRCGRGTPRWRWSAAIRSCGSRRTRHR